MKTRARGLAVGPSALIAGAAETVAGERSGKGRKKKKGDGLLQRSMSAVRRGIGKLGDALPLPRKNGAGPVRKVAKAATGLPRFVQRVGTVVGVATTGMRLYRQLRSDESEGFGQSGDTASSDRSAKTPAKRSSARTPRRSSSGTSRAKKAGGTRTKKTPSAKSSGAKTSTAKASPSSSRRPRAKKASSSPSTQPAQKSA